MTDWRRGYLSEIPYTLGHYRLQTPDWLDLTAELAGSSPPPGPVRYLDLGAGLAITSMATATIDPDAHVVAVDLMPRHVAGARATARALGLDNVDVVESDFGQLRADGRFTHVASHGVLSWVADDVVDDLIGAVDRHLDAGGLLYLSYNAQPGRGPMAPVQHLLRAHAEARGGPAHERLSAAFDAVQRLAAVETGWFQRFPRAREHLEQAAGRDPAYLVHEYLHDTWRPHWFSEVEALAGRARADFVASAEALAGLEDLELAPEALGALQGLSGTLRETTKDFLRSAVFRRDVFGRGLPSLTPKERERALLARTWALSRPREACALRVVVPSGAITLRSEDYEPLLDALVDGPRTGLELLDVLPHRPDRLVLNLHVLLGVEYVEPALSPARRARVAPRVARWNEVWSARTELDVVPWMSPVTGAVETFDRLGSLQVRALAAGEDDVPAYVLARLAEVGHHLVKEGQRLVDPDAARAEMVAVHQRFLERHGPWIRRHRIG